MMTSLKFCYQELLLLLIVFILDFRQSNGTAMAFTATRTMYPISTAYRSVNFHPESLPMQKRSRNKSHLEAANSVAMPLSTAVATAAATRGIGSFYLTRILFLRGLAFVYFFAFLIAYRQNKALIGDNGITPCREVLNSLERDALGNSKERDAIEKRKRSWEEQNITTPDVPDGGLFTIVKETKGGKLIGDLLKNSSSKVQNLQERLRYRSDGLGRFYPSLLWLISREDRENNMNKCLDRIALTGMGLSIVMFLLGAANVPLLFSFWICQRSLMSVGGPWYSFGWEAQLAELTFHALFMVPFLSLNAIPYKTPTPLVTIWAMRWFLFRIMIGAGLIKLRSGDQKWKQLTTMNYFYETQPVPNPLTRYFHKAPKLWHKFEVLVNHFVELIAPWLMLIPGCRALMIAGGVIQLVFQSVLITSGNLSFLNWITMLPAIFCFDDAFVSKVFSPGYTTSASIATYTHLSATTAGVGQLVRKSVNIFFAALIFKLSIPVVKNLLSKRQIMNGSFDPLRLVNTYGAFGTVEEERIELIVEAAVDSGGPWREYQFKAKPGDITRRPRFISPYHYRLDWLMWIASCCGSIDFSPWMLTFLLKLLQQDEEVIGLLESDPWKVSSSEIDSEMKPKYIRVEKYLYKFNELNQDNYWVRERVGRYFPPEGEVYSLETLQDRIQALSLLY
mmetsp:Transcript_28643/g.32889  ORF Transcript_28643/g.32889 Transcript_28643/m.32889 type:complete len:676 (-) Transcript_28643:119-2146(-)